MASHFNHVPAAGADGALFKELVKSVTERAHAFQSPTLAEKTILALPYITVSMRPKELKRISVRVKKLGVDIERRDKYKDVFKRHISRPPMQKIGIMIETMVAFLLENGRNDNDFWAPFKATLPLAEKIVRDVFYKVAYKGHNESLIVTQGLFNDDKHRCLVDFAWCSTVNDRPVLHFYELKVSSDKMPGHFKGFTASAANTVVKIKDNKIVLHAFRQMLPAILSARQYVRRNADVFGGFVSISAGVVFASVATSDVSVFVYHGINDAWIKDLQKEVRI